MVCGCASLFMYWFLTCFSSDLQKLSIFSSRSYLHPARLLLFVISATHNVIVASVDECIPQTAWICRAPFTLVLTLEYLQDFIYYMYVFYMGLLKEPTLKQLQGSQVVGLKLSVIWQGTVGFARIRRFAFEWCFAGVLQRSGKLKVILLLVFRPH